MANLKNVKDGFRVCFRCKCEFPTTTEHFYKDSARPLGLSYECKSCLSKRKVGRDRRSERWANHTPEQREKAQARNKRYSKTDKGRAISLQNAYRRVDACDLTSDEVLHLIRQPCIHCGTVDMPIGLDRIDNSKPHIKGNVVPSCAPCNFARGDGFTFEEMQRIGVLITEIFRDRLSG